MSKEIRRLHRKQTQFTNFNSSQSVELPDSPEPIEPNVRDDSEDNPPLRVNSYSPIYSNDINAIRAEFQEDTYHCKLAESDFSDDTHDWGGELHDLSDDYWHFLGSFE